MGFLNRTCSGAGRENKIMPIRSFKDLEVYQNSYKAAVLVLTRLRRKPPRRNSGVDEGEKGNPLVAFRRSGVKLRRVPPAVSFGATGFARGAPQE